MADDEEGGGLEEEVVCAAGAPDWVVTFGDMMSLLLTFFILLLSFATMDVLRFKELAGTIKQGFGIKVKEQEIIIPKAEDLVQRKAKVEYNARRILQMTMRRRFQPKSRVEREATVNVQVFQTYRGVVVLFPAEDVFVPGTDRIRPDAKGNLEFIAAQARAQLDNFDLLAEVRASQEAQRDPQFKDSWALTAAQAVSVTQFLREAGDLLPSRVTPVGRGPAPPTPPPATRQTPTPGVRPGPTVEFTFLSRTLKPERK